MKEVEAVIEKIKEATYILFLNSSSLSLAAIIELLSSIATTLSSLEQPAVVKTEEPQDWSGLWDVKPLTKEEFTLLDVGTGLG